MATAPHDGFAQLVHAEWTKLRTVRGWLVGLLVAVVLTIGIGLLGPLGSQISCVHVDGGGCSAQSPPKGPDGREVVDDKTIVYRFLSGDGSITARLTDFDGEYAPTGDVQAGTVHGLQPWSKAGILIKDGIKPGSPYAAVLATGSHGVRMQYDYVHDLPGLAGPVSAATPRWLRLVRTGDVITGLNSADGAMWTAIGTVRLANLPHDLVIGVFAASPQYEVIKSSFGGTRSNGGPTTATGTFDRIALTGQTSGDWTVPPTYTGSGPDGQPLRPQGGDGPKAPTGAVQHGSDGFVITGSGNIAPMAVSEGSGKTVESALAGTFAGLIAVIVVAALTMTAEYRRGLIRTSLAASPRRGRLLAAKATVLGGASFVTGLAAAAIAVPSVTALEHHKGLYVFHASAGAQIRIVVGTAALLAVAAVLALAVGTIVRRGAAAVAAVIVVIVLPYILAVASVLPAGAAQWLTRLTPAAAFAVQQTVTSWPQVTAVYTPTNGYYPLSPWTGLAVLCLYAAVAYALAHRLLLRRDA
ncbi:MAG: ABC transporter permease subunit [Catenulisporales bacterium]|nr:ABC transporter permease subunit [Catenulisporales bacterium]